MPFNSLLFVTAFFPAFAVLYWACPKRAKNALLLALSLVFYAWGAPWFLPVLLVFGTLNYAASRVLARRRGSREAGLIMGSVVSLHLSVLAYYKYSNFFLASMDDGLAWLHLDFHSPWSKVVLPIGISFLTFEQISYIVDVYRGHARPARSLADYLLFLTFFPHAIAGPIFRWKDLESQLVARDARLDDAVDGVSRFAWGLAKKVLIADAAGVTADMAFGLPPVFLTAGVAWLGAFAYAIQIFFDFSGYSDMAIGLGKMAGFTFKENFDDPYISTSITEFWTRWHISLSSWLRDYLYIPLGGNRGGEARTRINMLIVFVLSGLWHGAAWTFVAWGLYHGVLVVLERSTQIGAFWRKHAPSFVALPVTFALTVIGWVFFRARTMTEATSFLLAMFGFGNRSGIAPLLRGELLPARTFTCLAIAVAFVLVRATFRAWRAPRWALVAISPAFFLLALMQIVNTKFVPIIYFKF